MFGIPFHYLTSMNNITTLPGGLRTVLQHTKEPILLKVLHFYKSIRSLRHYKPKIYWCIYSVKTMAYIAIQCLVKDQLSTLMSAVWVVARTHCFFQHQETVLYINSLENGNTLNFIVKCQLNACCTFVLLHSKTVIS